MSDYTARSIASLAASVAFGEQFRVTGSTLAVVLQVAFLVTTVIYTIMSIMSFKTKRES